MSLIQVNALSKSYESYKKEVGLKNSFKNFFSRQVFTKIAVNNISLEIDQGEIVGFLGPNGAGKTTTLKMLSGILFPTSGSATVAGYIPWERKNEFKRLFSIVMGQKNQLWWDLPASESLYLNKCIYEIPDKDYTMTIGELSELLEVKELLNVQVRRLSLGERMKMELMAALLHKPKILFLDEPTIGLDIISQKKIREFLKSHNQQFKTTIMLTSHYMNDIEDLCKRVIVINEGRNVFDGNLSDTTELLGGKKVLKIQVSQKVNIKEIQEYGNIKEYSDFSATIEVEKHNIKEVSKRILDQLPVIDFTIEDIPIEEGITLLYQKGNHRC